MIRSVKRIQRICD